MLVAAGVGVAALVRAEPRAGDAHRAVRRGRPAGLGVRAQVGRACHAGRRDHRAGDSAAPAAGRFAAAHAPSTRCSPGSPSRCCRCSPSSTPACRCKACSRLTLLAAGAAGRSRSGCCVGKAVGVFGAVVAAGALRRSRPCPSGASWRQFFGVCVLCGIGFTMSLFIGALAFEGQGPIVRDPAQARRAVRFAAVGAAGRRDDRC